MFWIYLSFAKWYIQYVPLTGKCLLSPLIIYYYQCNWIYDRIMWMSTKQMKNYNNKIFKWKGHLTSNLIICSLSLFHWMKYIFNWPLLIKRLTNLNFKFYFVLLNRAWDSLKCAASESQLNEWCKDGAILAFYSYLHRSGRRIFYRGMSIVPACWVSSDGELNSRRRRTAT